MIHAPWRALTGEGLQPWTLTVRSGLTGEVTLTGSEVLDLCAAIELDRVQPADAVHLLTHRRITGRTLVWCHPVRLTPREGDRRRRRDDDGPDLMDGARGLSRRDAPATGTVVGTLARVGVEVVSWSLLGGSTAREALEQVRRAG